MKTDKTSASYKEPPNANCRDLHIYYVKGRVDIEADRFGPAFIGNWLEDSDSFLFFSRDETSLVKTLVDSHACLVLEDYYRMSYEQWHGEPLKSYTVGRLHIHAPWEQAAGDAGGDARIVLDPGVVFGTGAHPTTRDCLTALQLAMENQRVATVLDLGAGTGVLALAAARLGANRVLAVDMNFLAAQTSLKNVRLNHLADKVLVVQGNAKNFMDLACDLMVSNIHYAVMRPMVEAPEFRLHKQFILSGLLRSQAREIEHLLLRRSVKILRKWEQESVWHTFWGQNG